MIIYFCNWDFNFCT